MSATDGRFSTPTPVNEPVRGYAPGSTERASLEAEVARQLSEVVEIPCVIGGERIFTGRTVDVTNPGDHRHILAKAHLATDELVQKAIQSSLEAQAQWAAMPWQDRAAILLKAADLLAGPWRDRLNAATMLGQGKTCHQAEIDSASRLIDFLRFNAKYAQQIMEEQPSSNPGMWNRLDHRPLEGFVFAVTPFNFTAIALNLPTAPALMGNVVLWKPSNTQLHSAWIGYQLLEEAGFPPGVINFLPGNGADVGDIAIRHLRLRACTSRAARAYSNISGPRSAPTSAAIAHTRESSVRRAERTSSWHTQAPTLRRSLSRLRAAALSTKARSAQPLAEFTSPARCGEPCPNDASR